MKKFYLLAFDHMDIWRNLDPVAKPIRRDNLKLIMLRKTMKISYLDVSVS